LRLSDKTTDDRLPHSFAPPGFQNIDVTDSSKIDPRQIGVGIQSADSDESAVCQRTEQAFARATEIIGASCPVLDEPVKETKAMAYSFIPEVLETGRKRMQPDDLNPITHIRYS